MSYAKDVCSGLWTQSPCPIKKEMTENPNHNDNYWLAPALHMCICLSSCLFPPSCRTEVAVQAALRRDVGWVGPGEHRLKEGGFSSLLASLTTWNLKDRTGSLSSVLSYPPFLLFKDIWLVIRVYLKNLFTVENFKQPQMWQNRIMKPILQLSHPSVALLPHQHSSAFCLLMG